MAKYPAESCRNCGWALWTWSDYPYREGKKRIIVQKPGTCRAVNSKAGTGRMKSPLNALHPLSSCDAWKKLD